MLSTDWICLNMSCCTGAVDVEVAVKYAISAIEICKEGDVEIPPIKSNRPPHSVEIRQIYYVIENNTYCYLEKYIFHLGKNTFLYLDK